MSGFTQPLLQTRGALRGLPHNSSQHAIGYANGSTPSSRSYFIYSTDFLNAADLVVGTTYIKTDVGTQTISPPVAVSLTDANGIMYIDSDATDGDGIGLQFTTGPKLIPAASRILACEWYVTHENWDANHWFVGLAETAAPIMDANGDLAASTEYVGFHHNADDDADGIPRFVVAGANNTETTGTSIFTPSAGVDNTYRRFGVRIVGTDQIEWWVDDQKAATHTLASAFTGTLVVSWGNVMNGASGDRLNTDFFNVAGTR